VWKEMGNGLKGIDVVMSPAGINNFEFLVF